MNDSKTKNILEDPRYIELVRTRSRLGWLLTIIVFLVYFGFITLVAFHKNILAIPVGSGVMTLSIPLGVGVILFTVIITGYYIYQANRYFDSLTEALQEVNK